MIYILGFISVQLFIIIYELFCLLPKDKKINIEQVKEKIKVFQDQKVQFIEPVSFQEKYKKAKNITEITNG